MISGQTLLTFRNLPQEPGSLVPDVFATLQFYTPLSEKLTLRTVIFLAKQSISGGKVKIDLT